MEITATVRNSVGSHSAEVSTKGRSQLVAIPAKADGAGSTVNGGELLFLALATCYCNDVYREAGLAELRVDRVEVTVTGEFAGRGDPASNVRYAVRVESPEPESAIRALLAETDRVAEIHDTLRRGVDVKLGEVTVE
jgi:organic hydroperoxide reductase OsmC/OhrA